MQNTNFNDTALYDQRQGYRFVIVLLKEKGRD